MTTEFETPAGVKFVDATLAVISTPVSSVAGGVVTSVTGTDNRVTASPTTGGVVITTPQDTHQGASPTFAGLQLKNDAAAANATIAEQLTQSIDSASAALNYSQDSVICAVKTAGAAAARRELYALRNSALKKYIEIDGQNDLLKMHAPLINDARIFFSASRSTTLANVIGGSTTYIAVFDAVDAGVGLGYNPLTGVFTAPVSGLYQFSWFLGLSNLANSNNTGYAGLQGPIRLYVGDAGNFGTQRDSLNQYGVFGAPQVLLNAGQTASVQITLNGALAVGLMGVSPRVSFFTGALLC